MLAEWHVAGATHGAEINPTCSWRGMKAGQEAAAHDRGVVLLAAGVRPRDHARQHRRDGGTLQVPTTEQRRTHGGLAAGGGRRGASRHGSMHGGRGTYIGGPNAVDVQPLAFAVLVGVAQGLELRGQGRQRDEKRERARWAGGGSGARGTRGTPAPLGHSHPLVDAAQRLATRAMPELPALQRALRRLEAPLPKRPLGRKRGGGSPASIGARPASPLGAATPGKRAHRTGAAHKQQRGDRQGQGGCPLHVGCAGLQAVLWGSSRQRRGKMTRGAGEWCILQRAAPVPPATSATAAAASDASSQLAGLPACTCCCGGGMAPAQLLQLLHEPPPP